MNQKLTTDVCKVILDHEVEQEHFDMVDANGDGEVSLDEVLEWAMSNEYMKKRSATYKDRMFSENGNIPDFKSIQLFQYFIDNTDPSTFSDYSPC